MSTGTSVIRNLSNPFNDDKKWKHFSVQCSTISERTLLFGSFPVFARLSFW
jgi:hypothetical protein